MTLNQLKPFRGGHGKRQEGSHTDCVEPCDWLRAGVLSIYHSKKDLKLAYPFAGTINKK